MRRLWADLNTLFAEHPLVATRFQIGVNVTGWSFALDAARVFFQDVGVRADSDFRIAATLLL